MLSLAFKLAMAFLDLCLILSEITSCVFLFDRGCVGGFAQYAKQHVSPSLSSTIS